MKKTFALRWITTFLTIAVSAYFLYYSVRFYSANPEKRLELSEQIPDLHKKIVNLGLDLQGGMRLVLEVDKSQLTPDEQKDVLDRTLTVIENRVNGLGVAEPTVQKQGENRLIIELPGLQDAERAKKVLGNTALLEFKLLRDVADLQKALEIVDNALAGTSKKSTMDDTTKSASDTAKAADRQDKVAQQIFKGADDESADTSETALETRRPFTSLLTSFGAEGDIATEERNRAKINRMLNDTAVITALRQASMDGSVFAWGNEIESDAGRKYYRLFYLKKKPELTGAAVEDATPSISSGGLQAGAAVVNLKLTSAAARKFAKITGANIDKRLAIVLDSTVYSAPVIKSKIAGGQAEITGMKNMDEARDLSIVLRAGALPAPAMVVEERTVGPTLGKETIRASVIAMLLASLVILVFMLVYYGFMGFVADVALAMNMVLLFGFMAATNSTLTLPGVAGLILTLAMAVDSNVLINERMREELWSGKTVRSAISAAFSRVFTVIFDSNLTTLVIAIILFQYGTGPIKGFALTLSAGLVINMFTALFVAKLLTETYAEKRQIQKLSVGRLTVFRNAKYAFIKHRKIAIGLSLVVLLVSLVSVALHKGLNMGIDFRGGTMLTLKFREPMGQKTRLIQDQVATMVKGTPEVKLVGKETDHTVQIMVQPQENDRGLGAQIQEKLSAVPGLTAFDMLRQEKVGPRIGKELKWKATVALVLSFIFIILYLGWRFKQIGYGFGAFVSLIHDVAIAVGFLSLTGREFSLQIVAALLTIIGYSVNDTIVIFDRVRENSRLLRDKLSPEQLFDLSINQTLSRSILTTLTVIMVLVVLYIFGGQSINDFAFVLLVGAIAGSYSTIFIASPVVLWWNKKSKAKRA